MTDRTQEVTQLLNRIERGDARAADDLLPVVYDELRAHAGRLMGMERKDHTLQRTALVHEAYLKLVRPGVAFSSRLHFYNAAGLAMRRILIDHASARAAQKRGGGGSGAAREVDLDEADDVAAHGGRGGGGGRGGPNIDILALDEAMTRLAERAPRQAQVVNLRFFAGLKDAETAALLGVTEKTVQRDWATARLWLYDQVKG